MLPEILLPFLKRTFSHVDRYCWLSFTFDKDKQLVTCRKGRAALIDRLCYVAYASYIFLQAYGILWHNSDSTLVTKINSTIIILPHVTAMFVMMYWKADPGIVNLLNVITRRTIEIEEDKGKIFDFVES